MLMKVYGGTRVQADASLCDTCRFSRIIRGRRFDEEIVFCSALVMPSVQIRFKVASCTEYVDSREPGYHELLEKAWILRPGAKKCAAGFVRAADLSEEEHLALYQHPSDD